MGSLAFWAEKNSPLTKQDNENIETSAVMNFNLWSQCDKKCQSYLDIGFIVSNITQSKKLHFYIPFGQEKDIKDLSPVIRNTTVIGAIFNEKYSVTDLSGTKCFWPVQDESTGSSAFVIYSWSDQQEGTAISIHSDGNIPGVFLDIDVDVIKNQIDNLNNPAVKKDSKFYFRFRTTIPSSESDESMVRKYNPPNTFLQSTFATTYIIDFRFNDNRSLPDMVSRATIQKGNAFVNVNKLHFLLMTKAHVDVETGIKDVSVRELERDVWNNYINKEFETKDIVAYHTSRKDTTRQWEFFAKLKVNNSTWKVILIYLLVLGVITVIFNIISAFLCQVIGLT